MNFIENNWIISKMRLMKYETLVFWRAPHTRSANPFSGECQTYDYCLNVARGITRVVFLQLASCVVKRIRIWFCFHFTDINGHWNVFRIQAIQYSISLEGVLPSTRILRNVEFIYLLQPHKLQCWLSKNRTDLFS